MKLLSIFFLLLCLIEIYGQRTRTTNNNQDISTQEPSTVRGRGRSRFTATQDSPQSSERPSTNRRASTRTRIHSNNPKAAAERRARPTEAPRGYAVEEVNNDSPIDSFRRQSKPRVLTESRFEIPTVTVTRRPLTFEAVRSSPLPPAADEFAARDVGFGSTARAILQARGETLPAKTTTPIIDEAYLLNNFGSTIRSIAAFRNEVPIQRATPLRSEVPILDQEDIPSSHSSLRGDPLPSLRGSDLGVERQPSRRGRKNGQAKVTTDKARANPRYDRERKTTEATPVEEIARLEPKTEAPESVQGIFEQFESVTETQPFEASSESLLLEEEDLRRTSGAEVVTQKISDPPAPRKSVINNRRNGGRGRAEAASEFQPTVAPRTRPPRPRASQSFEEANTVSSIRTRGTRRRYDDAAVAESRRSGPSVFTAEQYQEVTSSSRTGRRIDSRFEGEEKISVDLASITTTRPRSSGRRATPTSTERTIIRDRSSSRGRSRSRVSPEESTIAPLSRTTNSRRSSSTDDTTFYGDKTSNRADLIETTGRRETNGKLDIIEPKAISRGNLVETPLNRRVATSRSNTLNSRSRASVADSRRQAASRTEQVEPRNIISSRNSGHRQIPDEAVPFGEKSSRTRTHSPQITTTTTEEPTTILNVRSKSRIYELPSKIDESKLEVLPLFEREVKTVPAVRSRGHRSGSSVNRRQNLSQDHMHVSATENDVKFVEKPTTNAFTRVTVTRTESVDTSTSRTRLSTRTASTTPSTSTTETETTRRPTPSTTTTTTTTTPPPETSVITKKWVTRSPPLIRESVVAEVNEVTSKSTFTRRKKVPKAKAVEMLARGAKKSDAKLTDLGKKASSEEINDEDNYPAPFKALIQAKKKQEESRPSQSSARGATAANNITSAEKVPVTFAATPRGSSTARVVTTESPSAGKRAHLVNEIINDNENELYPKPTVISTTTNAPTRSARLRQLPKFSEKPKYTQKYTKTSSEKPRYSPEKATSKTTSKKTYSPKLYSTRDPVEHHSRRKALRSTAFPPSTTPMNLVNREAKFSAKFVRKELKSLELNTSGNNRDPKRAYSIKKDTEREDNERGEKVGRNVSVTQTAKPSLPIKKFNSSRYSSRYRGDPSQRSTVLKSTTSAPFYIPTIPTPAYIPTVPTVAPSVTPVGGFVAEKDNDLGLEVISFDDPVNTIPSADLVNGEYLTTDKNIRLLPMVKDGTTEKPVSIIERIINSITSISTTAVPNITTTTTNSPSSTSIGATENSAILKLAPKKTITKDKTIPDDQTNIIETITSEKPTTIIEKIRSSLSAIQSNEVGTSDFNSISSSPTTPLSTVTKYSAKFRGSSVGTTALPAPLPLSTSINPLSVFDEIDENQILEKRTIGKLLNILNGLVSTNSPETSEKLVVVTPKNVLNSVTSPNSFVATTFSSQEPLEAILLNGIESRSGFIDSESSKSSSVVNTETTSSGSTVNTESFTLSSIVNTEYSTVETEAISNTESSTLSVQNSTNTPSTVPTPTKSLNTETNLPENTEISTPMTTQTDSITAQSSTKIPLDTTSSTSAPSLTTTSKTTIPTQANSLSIDFPTTSTSTAQESTTTATSETTTVSDTITTTSLPQATTNVDGLSSSTIYTFPSTLPTIPNIEVSPGSVSIFSANDLSNYITQDDNVFNTVTISSRVGFDNNLLTATTSSTTTTEGVTSTTMDSSTSTESATVATTTENIDMTTMIPSATSTDSTTISTSTMVDTTTMLSTTVTEESTTMLTTIISSNKSKSKSSTNSPILSNRSGRILSSDIGEPIGNSIEVSTSSTTTSTTPDYFIFAVLNNNTILRKRPPTIPNKDTPFIIVGLYPNNTVVRKFPNGTLIPMDQIIKVRGFDTRPNPPPLVEITSNQVTDTTNGMTTLDNNSVTVDSNRMARLLENEKSLSSFPPRVAISSTTSGTPLSTKLEQTSTTPTTTTNRPEMMSTASSIPGTTTSSKSSYPSTTTSGTTMMFTSTLPSSTTSQGTSTSMSSNIVQIMAIPGETRISKAQTFTAEPSTVQTSTAQASTSTISQSTDTIPPTLGEILNGKTVNALANLLTNGEVPTTQASNFKTLEVNQNSITSTTTVQSTTTELSTEEALFTSPTISTESTTQFSSSADRLLSSTLISTVIPVSTTTTESTTPKITITSTTQPPTTTTTTMRTTTPEIKTTTQNVETTTRMLATTVEPQVKTTVAPRTTTEFPSFTPGTILPSILTTLFPNLLRNAVTTPSSPLSSTRKPFTSAEFSNSIGDRYELLSTAGTTARPTTVLPQSSTSQRISTTTPPTTTTRQTTIQTTTEPITTTTTQKPTTTQKRISTTAKESKSATPTPSTKEETDVLFEQLKNSGKLKNLNEEQRKNLEEIERIEKEQAELLKQLTLLTTMFGGQAGKLPNLPPLPNTNNPVGGNSNSLANRVIAMAMERDRTSRSSKPKSPETTTKKITKPTTKRPNSIQDQLSLSQPVAVTPKTTPSLEDVLKQYNLNGLSTPVPLTSTYGKTDEALLAAILKEQGIGPTTPKILGEKVKEAGIFEENPTTKPPKPKPKPRATTTARPVGGRLMQGLNWLLDILDPPTTKRPASKRSKPKTQPPKDSTGDEELLTNQPTRITPVVTAAPVTRPNLSQEEIQVLIKQLEAVQNDPNAADQLDFSKIKHLQNLINVNEGIQVTSVGQHGATSRATPRPPKISATEKDPFLTEINKKPRSSTFSTLSVSNSIDDDVEIVTTTARTRVLPPVSLNPIPGIDNQGDSLIRSNLLTAAVNVTRAISSFLGSALQGATRGFRTLIGNGSAMVGNIAQTSSAATG